MATNGEYFDDSTRHSAHYDGAKTFADSLYMARPNGSNVQWVKRLTDSKMSISDVKYSYFIIKAKHWITIGRLKLLSFRSPIVYDAIWIWEEIPIYK